MPKVSFTSALKRFYPKLKPREIKASTISELLDALDQEYPGIKGYIVDERGALRKHVNIYIGELLIDDRTQLSDKVTDQDEVLIFQALSGG